MNTTPTPQVPGGPMTRACARAIEHEVNSLLSDSPFHTCETWLVPKTEMLCVPRYREHDHEEARSNDQDSANVEQATQAEELLNNISHRTSGASRM